MYHLRVFTYFLRIWYIYDAALLCSAAVRCTFYISFIYLLHIFYTEGLLLQHYHAYLLHMFYVCFMHGGLLHDLSLSFAVFFFVDFDDKENLRTSIHPSIQLLWHYLGVTPLSYPRIFHICLTYIYSSTHTSLPMFYIILSFLCFCGHVSFTYVSHMFLILYVICLTCLLW